MAATAILAAGRGTGLLGWKPSEGSWMRLLLGALIVPALLEEFVFRGLLTPARGEVQRPVLASSPGLAAFVAWHAVGALPLPGAALFLRPDFLLCAFLLGLACTLMRLRTGSLWPAVAFHAAVVSAWQALLGGISPADVLGWG